MVTLTPSELARVRESGEQALIDELEGSIQVLTARASRILKTVEGAKRDLSENESARIDAILAEIESAQAKLNALIASDGSISNWRPQSTGRQVPGAMPGANGLNAASGGRGAPPRRPPAS